LKRDAKLHLIMVLIILRFFNLEFSARCSNIPEWHVFFRYLLFPLHIII